MRTQIHKIATFLLWTWILGGLVFLSITPLNPRLSSDSSNMISLSFSELKATRRPMASNEVWNMTLCAEPDSQAGMDLVECTSGGFAILSGIYNLEVGIRLIRTDSDGNHLWNHTYITSDFMAESLVQCSDGGFAILARNGTSSHSNGLLIRTDSTGTQVWNRTYSSQEYYSCHDLIECSLGGFAFVGYLYPEGALLMRTDANGDLLWNATFGPPASEAYSLTEVSAGGFAFAGNAFIESLDNHQAALWRTDASGNQLWNNTYGNSEFHDFTYSVVECAAGGFAFAGRTTEGAWLVRTSNTGTQLWNHTWLTLGRARCLVEATGGGFALVSYCQSRAWLARTDANGNHLWAGLYGNDRYAGANAIIEPSSGGFVFTGFIDNGSPTGNDVWLVRVLDRDAEPPTWIEEPTDQTIYEGDPFQYQLNATDNAGIASWWISDTTHFDIDTEGVITNAITLTEGSYPLEARAYDPYDNYCTATFTVTVLRGFGDIPGFPIAAIALGLLITILPTILIRNYRRRN